MLAYEPLGQVSVAGRAQPVGTYEVAASETAAAEPVAPFVGRDRELDRLCVAFDRAHVERSAVLVTILGSPGLGKTRLSRELAAVVGADDNATTFEIRCDRSGGSTFAPIAELIREAAGLEDADTDGHGASTHERIGALLHVDDDDRTRESSTCSQASSGPRRRDQSKRRSGRSVARSNRWRRAVRSSSSSTTSSGRSRSCSTCSSTLRSG